VGPAVDNRGGEDRGGEDRGGEGAAKPPPPPPPPAAAAPYPDVRSTRSSTGARPTAAVARATAERGECWRSAGWRRPAEAEPASAEAEADKEAEEEEEEAEEEEEELELEEDDPEEEEEALPPPWPCRLRRHWLTCASATAMATSAPQMGQSRWEGGTGLAPPHMAQAVQCGALRKVQAGQADMVQVFKSTTFFGQDTVQLMYLIIYSTLYTYTRASTVFKTTISTTFFGQDIYLLMNTTCEKCLHFSFSFGTRSIVISTNCFLGFDFSPAGRFGVRGT
jgi:hypothetical protein